MALEYLSEIMGGNFVSQKPEILKSEIQKSSLKILNIGPVSDKKLSQYLNSRGIFIRLAKQRNRPIDKTFQRRFVRNANHGSQRFGHGTRGEQFSKTFKRFGI